MSIKKFILFVALLIISSKLGWDYITSEDFQKFGDAKKAPWTCHVNIVLGGLYDVMSEYQLSYDVYERVLKRCPNSPVASEALYQMGNELDSLNRFQDAIQVYQQYLDQYPGGEKTKLAQKAIDRIKFSR